MDTMPAVSAEVFTRACADLAKAGAERDRVVAAARELLAALDGRIQIEQVRRLRDALASVD